MNEKIQQNKKTGEGGIFALLALLKRSKGVPRVVKYCAPILAICSAAFLFGVSFYQREMNEQRKEMNE